MNLNNYSTHPWKIIEEEWNPENVEASESIFSLGNGAMGQRANFEEDYSIRRNLCSVGNFFP